jgi:hypothetical protein
LNWEAAHVLVDVFFGFVSIISILMAWQAKRTHAQKSAVAEVDRNLRKLVDDKHEENLANFREMFTEIRNIGSRLTKMETTVEHQPTVRDMDLMRQALTSLSGTVSELKGSSDASTRMVERMNTFLMERGT